MMQTVRQKYTTVVLVSSLVVLLDQLAKFFICKYLSVYDRIAVIDGFFNIVHIKNPGMAFGLFRSFGSQYKMLSLLLVLVVALILFAFLFATIKKQPGLQTGSFALILGGAVGNLIDRFRLGSVVDFIDIHWRSLYRWPAFNLADSAITVGIAILVFCEVRGLIREKRLHGKHPARAE